MAISKFIPEIWAASILEALEKQLVFLNLVNRDYEGEIQNAGDTVHITGINDISVGDYVANTDITIEQATDKEAATLKIDQAKYFAFELDDVSKAQALPDLAGKLQNSAGRALAYKAESYLANVMKDNVANGNKLKAVTTTTPDAAYETLVDLGTVLSDNSVPADRWVTVTPSFYGLLLKDPRFVKASESAYNTLRTGQVGQAAGFTVYQSTFLPVSGSKATIIAGSNHATTFAQQLAKVEAARKEKGFGDIVKGLHLYGAKVVRPEALATVDFTIGTTPGV